MAKVFVDANYFIALANRAPEADEEVLDKHQGFISTLSCHILFYINKVKVPDEKMKSFINDFNIIDFNQNILERALHGPTKDLEDNVQLQSAVEADCDYFLTHDKKLLALAFFGKTRIAATMS